MDNVTSDMQKLKAALERTDARAIIMEEKYWSMVELVNNMKKDRKHHDEIISECELKLYGINEPRAVTNASV